MDERKFLREAAFRALFQLEFNSGEDDERENYEDLAISAATEEFDMLQKRHLRRLEKTVKGTRLNLEKIDAIIIAHLRDDWKFSRLASSDRNLLRLAVYEMKFAEKKLPPNIVINEIVELAKKYGTDDSGRFVNGVLSAISA